MMLNFLKTSNTLQKAWKRITRNMLANQGRKIFIRKCSKPETQVKEIYDALGYNYYPFIRKSLPVRQTGVLPENEHRKNEIPVKQKIDDS